MARDTVTAASGSVSGTAVPDGRPDADQHQRVAAIGQCCGQWSTAVYGDRPRSDWQPHGTATDLYVDGEAGAVTINSSGLFICSQRPRWPVHVGQQAAAVRLDGQCNGHPDADQHQRIAAIGECCGQWSTAVYGDGPRSVWQPHGPPTDLYVDGERGRNDQ